MDLRRKEVTMLRKGTNTLLVGLLALAIIFASTSCEKLKISNLQANHHFTKANNFYSEGKYRDAIEEYEIALIHNPNLIEAYRLLGESYKNLFKPGVDTAENMEKANKALESLSRAYELNPNNKDIIYSLGGMYDKLRNFEEAERLYLRILEMEPTKMDNYYIVAQFYQRYAAVRISGEQDDTEESEVGKTPFQKAEEMYLRRIETDPENPEGYAYMAQFYDDVKPIPKFDKANEFHMMRIKLEPENAEAWYTVGVNRFSKGYRLQRSLPREERIKLGEKSLEALFKAIKIDPSYPEPYAYVNLVYRNIHANLYPERHSRYIAEADRYTEKFNEARKRQAERRRLEQELRGRR